MSHLNFYVKNNYFRSISRFFASKASNRRRPRIDCRTEMRVIVKWDFLETFQHCDILIANAVSIHPFSINDAKHREGGAGIFHADWI